MLEQIRSAIHEGIQTLLQRNHMDWSVLSQLTVAGNTP